MIIYAPDNSEIGDIAKALERLRCSRATLYNISKPCEGGRKLTRYPNPNGKRGPDKKKRKRRPEWEPTI